MRSKDRELIEKVKKEKGKPAADKLKRKLRRAREVKLKKQGLL